MPKTWFGRLLATVVAILVLVLAVFFFTLFLIAVSVLTVVVVILVLLLWARQKLNRKASQNIIDVEYSVKEPKESKDIKKLGSRTN